MKGPRIGCDIVFIPRFKKILKRSPAMRRRIFLPEEESESLERLAGIFAAKEATIKALSLSSGNWHKIEVSHKKNGKPFLSGEALKDYHGELSISHDGDYVVAFVLFS